MNEHQRAAELLTWQVIGRLNGEDLNWLGEHLENCERCRAEQRVQRRIRDAVAAQPTVEFAPQASFNRLWQQIEAGASMENPHAPAAGAARGRRAQAGASRGYWLKGLAAAQAAAIVLLIGALWHGRPDSFAPVYRTVTEQSGELPGEGQVKAIFADQVRLADVKEILAGANMRIVAGPNDSGVYTLVGSQASTASTARAALARLRADPRVRFAALSQGALEDTQAR